MPRQERGLFGIKKDPKNPILFSFNVPVGEEMPSDSDDSDYDPDDSDASKPRKRKKISKKTTSSQAKVKKTTSTVLNSGPEVILPPEIWLQIFQYVVAEDGALPFLIRAPKVSQLWKEVSVNPKLWTKVDLSYGWCKLTEKNFKWLCANRLSECTHMNLTNSKITASIAAIKALSSHCTNLKTLNLSRCQKLPSDSVVTIVNGCRHLQDVDLTATTVDAVSPPSLCHLIDKCGANLRRLVIAENQFKAFNVILNNLMEKCPNLEHLDVSNAKFSSFMSLDIEKFQTACPKLKVLGLANTPFRASTASHRVQEESLGFPCLEEISLAVTSDNTSSSVTEEVVQRFLKSSVNLHLLDLRGCKNAQAISCLEYLAPLNLEQLYLSRSAACTCHNLHTIVRKWRHSLTDVDLSWNNFRDGILELAIVSLKSGNCDTPCKLQTINLSGTPVTMTMVRSLLLSITNLKSLDLTSCRDVSRGCKREYKTKRDLKQLLETTE